MAPPRPPPARARLPPPAARRSTMRPAGFPRGRGSSRDDQPRPVRACSRRPDHAGSVSATTERGRLVMGARQNGRRAYVIGAVVAAGLVLAACVPSLGGPDDRFGNDPTRGGTQPGMWAAINGPFARRADGDPYATKCAVGPSAATACDASGLNPDYDPAGHLWSIDVPKQAIGIPVTVAVYDPADGPNSTLGEPTAQFAPFATSFGLFDTSGSNQAIDLDPANLMPASSCGSGPGYRVFAAGSTESANAWYTLCTFTPTRPGVYPLQVKSSAIPGVADSGDGWQNF